MNVNKNTMPVLKHKETIAVIEAMPLCTIEDAAAEAIEFSKVYYCDVELIFNDIKVPISATDYTKDVVSRYYKLLETCNQM